MRRGRKTYTPRRIYCLERMWFTVDLRHQKITLGEIMDYPGARDLLRKKFPLVFRKQFSPSAKSVTLEQLIALIGGFLPQRTLAETIQALEKL